MGTRAFGMVRRAELTGLCGGWCHAQQAVQQRDHSHLPAVGASVDVEDLVNRVSRDLRRCLRC